MSEEAFTFATQGYLAAALALGRSFVEAHPGGRFRIVTIGPVDLADAAAGPGISFHPADAIPLAGPLGSRYPPRGLCAALKPLAFSHLFEATGAQRLLYLDADMLVFRRLDEAWSMLDHAHALLVPAVHAHDGGDMAARRAREALAHGVFDTAFVGMRRGGDTSALLDWWSRQVFVDCIDAPDLGLYLDRRFLDIVPGAFPGVAVLRHRGYNAGAWLAGGEDLSLGRDGIEVNGEALACFHFRGYDPAQPRVLRGVDGAIEEDGQPVLASLLDAHARALAAPGTPPDRRTEPQSLVLANGVPLSRTLAAVALQAARRRLRWPSPGTDADGFCACATTPDPRAYGAGVAPLVSALLALRPDVAAAFPGAATDPRDAAFLHWLRSCGAREESLGLLLDRFGGNLTRPHPVEAALEAHPGEAGLQAAAAHLPGGAAATVARVLDGYFSDPALRRSVPLLHDDDSVAALAAAMTARLAEFPAVRHPDLLAFPRATAGIRAQLLLACLRYDPAVRARLGGPPTLFRAAAIREVLGSAGLAHAWPAVEAALLAPGDLPPLSQLDAFIATRPPLRELFPDADTDPSAALEQAHCALEEDGPDPVTPGALGWARRLLEGLGSADHAGMNLCGLLRDASGMGELARAYARGLEQASVPCTHMVLPGRVPARLDPDVEPGARYGWLDRRRPVNLVVANPHSRGFVEGWLDGLRAPGQANVAAWAWETERLPRRHAVHARGFDAIVSISRFSVDAIAAAVDCPVHLVHPAPDFAALAKATPARERLGLPADTLLFGFCFDTYSVLERKNPAGLLDAFRMAFGGRTDVGLVLKVNSPDAGDIDFARLKHRARGLNVFWIEERLSTGDTFDLMASLDAYASLHRAEGFGLTMAEAMALGKPVVATGYSGNLDFMDANCALLAAHAVTTTTRAHGAYPAGSRWAEPSVEDCARHLLALEDPALRQHVGAAGRAHVRVTLDPAASGRRLAAACAGAAGLPPDGLYASQNP